MKLALVHRYFWPDTPPYAVMLRYIARELAKNGHEVTVYSTQPSYGQQYDIGEQPWIEEMDGFLVKRIKVTREKDKSLFLRLFSVLKFSLSLLKRLISDRPDVIMIATTPPIIGGLVVRVASWFTGAQYIYHCQDLYPEVARVSGLLNGGMLYKFLTALDRQICDNALQTIVLSEDMKRSLLARGCEESNISVINNFELKSFSDEVVVPVAEGMMRKKGVFRVLFAGNIGRFQGLETVIDTAHKLSEKENIEFVFLGEGAAMTALKEQASELLGKTIKFFGRQPISVARKLIADSQLCVVSLNKGVYKYAFPSKTMTYMCEGVPVLMIVEPESGLSKMVRDEKIGIVVSPGDSVEFAEQIINLENDPQRLEVMRRAVNEYSSRHFKIESVLPRWVALYDRRCIE